MMLLPAIIFGSTLGYYLSFLLPDEASSLILVILLLFTSVKSFFKGRKLWKKETDVKSSLSSPIHLIETSIQNENDTQPDEATPKHQDKQDEEKLKDI